MGEPSTGSRTSSLAESLAARARAASDGRLALDVLAGMGAALGFACVIGSSFVGLGAVLGTWIS